MLSIHEYLETDLSLKEAEIVYYDHGPGEMADFLLIYQNDKEIKVEFYHCKSAGNVIPGDRVSDLYEVCGQAIKSTHKANRQLIYKNIEHRLNARKGRSYFIKGNLEKAEDILFDSTKEIKFVIIIVQPGVSKASLSKNQGNLLSAVNEHLVKSGLEELIVLASA